MERKSNKALRRIEHSKLNATVGLITSILMGVFSFIERTVFNQFFLEDYLGLYSFNYNIIYTLGYIEMGLSASVAFALYKPLDENNREQIAAIMQFFKKAYIIIGSIILLGGMLILPFLRNLVQTSVPIRNVQLYFILFLIANVSYYFINYKSILFTANQEEYKITLVTNITWTVLYIAEMLIAIKTQNFLYYSIAIMVSHIIKNTIIRIKANREYKYLKSIRKTRIDSSILDRIKKNTAGMAINKLGQVLVSSTDSVLISAMVGTAFLGKYSNYLMLSSGLHTLTSIIPNSITASIGNAGVSETRRSLSDGFYAINTGYFFAYSIITVLLSTVAHPIVSTFFGRSRVIENSTLWLLCSSFYLSCMREIILSYKSSLGLFWEDRKRPMLEGLTNFVSSIILGRWIGINGIILGTIISQVFVNLLLEPRIIFHNGLKRSILKYYLQTLGNMALTVIMIVISTYICNLLNISRIIDKSIRLGFIQIELSSFMQIIINSIVSIAISVSILYFFFRHSKQARSVIRTIKLAFWKKKANL